MYRSHPGRVRADENAIPTSMLCGPLRQGRGGRGTKKRPSSSRNSFSVTTRPFSFKLKYVLDQYLNFYFSSQNFRKIFFAHFFTAKPKNILRKILETLNGSKIRTTGPISLKLGYLVHPSKLFRVRNFFIKFIAHFALFKCAISSK